MTKYQDEGTQAEILSHLRDYIEILDRIDADKSDPDTQETINEVEKLLGKNEEK